MCLLVPTKILSAFVTLIKFQSIICIPLDSFLWFLGEKEGKKGLEWILGAQDPLVDEQAMGTMPFSGNGPPKQAANTWHRYVVSPVAVSCWPLQESEGLFFFMHLFENPVLCKDSCKDLQHTVILFFALEYKGVMMWGHILLQSSLWFKKERNSIVIDKRNKGIPPMKKTDSKVEEMHPLQHVLPTANNRMSHPA